MVYAPIKESNILKINSTKYNEKHPTNTDGDFSG